MNNIIIVMAFSENRIIVDVFAFPPSPPPPPPPLPSPPLSFVAHKTCGVVVLYTLYFLHPMHRVKREAAAAAAIRSTHAEKNPFRSPLPTYGDGGGRVTWPVAARAAERKFQRLCVVSVCVCVCTRTRDKEPRLPPPSKVNRRRVSVFLVLYFKHVCVCVCVVSVLCNEPNTKNPRFFFHPYFQRFLTYVDETWKSVITRASR